MSSVPFAPRARIPQTGININLGPESMGGFAMGLPGGSWLPGINDMDLMAALGATNNGNIPDHEITTTFPANNSINYSYVLEPWSDNSDERVTPGMCLFVTRTINSKKLTNAIPIFKLNEMLRLRHMLFMERVQSGSADETSFNNFINTHGEAILREYDNYVRNERTRNTAEALAAAYPAIVDPKTKDVSVPSLEDAYRLAQLEPCIYESLFGILSRWNFLGACVSKGDASGSGEYLDTHAYRQRIGNAGVTVALKATVANIWPDHSVELQPGSKCFFVIRRHNGEQGAYFQVESQATHTREYCQSGDVYYKVANKAFERGFVVLAGTVTERGARANREKQLIAMGIGSRNMIEAENASATLPQLVLQVRV